MKENKYTFIFEEWDTQRKRKIRKVQTITTNLQTLGEIAESLQGFFKSISFTSSSIKEFIRTEDDIYEDEQNMRERIMEELKEEFEGNDDDDPDRLIFSPDSL